MTQGSVGLTVDSMPEKPQRPVPSPCSAAKVQKIRGRGHAKPLADEKKKTRKEQCKLTFSQRIGRPVRAGQGQFDTVDRSVGRSSCQNLYARGRATGIAGLSGECG